MIGKLIKMSRTKNEGPNETPRPDLSRIHKRAPSQPETVDDIQKRESVSNSDLKSATVERSAACSPPSDADQTEWLKRDVAALKTAFDSYAQRVSSKDLRRQLFIASHNLRGTAAPFGNPVLGRLAGSLCNLLEQSDPDEPVIALANLHVEAMRAAGAIGPSAATDELAQTVCVALEDQVNAKLLASA